MIVTFTGPRTGMNALQETSVATVLSSFHKIHMVVHGGAEGADRQFHRLTAGFIRDVWPSKPDQYRWAIANCLPTDFVESVHPPPVRNARMIGLATVVIATPMLMTEQNRGGTWMTINMARKRNASGRITLPIHLCWPDGTITVEHPWTQIL